MPPTPGSLVDTLQQEIRQLRMVAFTHWDWQKKLDDENRAWRMPRFSWVVGGIRGWLDAIQEGQRKR
jgi:hypothetical protein